MFPLIATGALASASFTAWAVRGRSARVFGKSIWRGPTDRPTLAITFDDGPSESTFRILEILARNRVPATFFQCGANVDRLPALAREVVKAGHEIGNHTYSHPAFYFRSAKFMEVELSRAQEAIDRHTGWTPRWFRAPFGVRWFGLGAIQQHLQLTGAMWTVIGRDWKLDAEGIRRRISRGVSNGAILCLHDGRGLSLKPDIGETVEAVRRLVPELLDRGYTFETLERLLCPTK